MSCQGPVNRITVRGGLDYVHISGKQEEIIAVGRPGRRTGGIVIAGTRAVLTLLCTVREEP